MPRSRLRPWLISPPKTGPRPLNLGVSEKFRSASERAFSSAGPGGTYRRRPRRERAARNGVLRHQHAGRGIDELRRADGLFARTADAVDRPVAAPELRHRLGHRRDPRRPGLGAVQQDLPPGGLRLGRRHARSHRRQHPDGLRRRHRARLHGRPGHLGHVDAGRRFVSRAGLDHRRRSSDHQVPAVAGGERLPRCRSARRID